MTHTILRVAVDSPVDRLFDYLPGDDMPTEPEAYSAIIGSRLAVTFGRRTVFGILVATDNKSSYPVHKLVKARAILDEKPLLNANTIALCTWASRYYHASLGEVLSTALPSKLRSATITTANKSQTKTYWQLKDPNFTPSAQAKRQHALLKLLANGPIEHSELVSEAGKAALDSLAKKAVIDSFTHLHKTTSTPSSVALLEVPLPLNAQQQAALDQIELGRHQCYLLEGVTGSGKTEVYLQAIEQVINKGQQALVLVPEIGLTPQMIERFKQRFKASISLLHSQLTPSARLAQWQQARTANIIIGTRSAIFTPMDNVGLVVVDEEHDSSYKQAEGIRYNARDLAIVRASQSNIPIILGSATPSLESLYNIEHRHYQRLVLNQRATQQSLPDIEIIEGNDGDISPTIVQAISATLDAGLQVLVFINRRGFAPTLICGQCQWLSQCDRCDSRMTLHRQPAKLQCHHCGHTTTPPKQCPNCHSQQLQPLGQGTQRSELMLQSTFPHTPVIRIDRDSTRNKGQLQAALDKVNENQPCILVGTQMLAKGHHFSKVNLVIVLGADNGLLSTDFRGAERLGQLITQVAGRAGRETAHGQVLLQSQFPDHPQLTQLIKQGYSKFARGLMEVREVTQMPPFSHLAMIRADATSPLVPQQFLHAVRDEANRIQPATAQLRYIGPTPQAMEKRNNRYYHQLQINAHHRSLRQQLLAQLIPFMQRHSKAKSLRWHIDVDASTIG